MSDSFRIRIRIIDRSWRPPHTSQYHVEGAPDQEREGEYKDHHGQRNIDAALLDDDEQIGDTGDKKGDCDETHNNLDSVERSLPREDEEAGRPVISSKESDDEGLGRFHRKT